METRAWVYRAGAAALLATSLVLAACGDKAEKTGAAAAVAAAGGGEEKVLNIYNWPDYITDDMVANFEKETGIKVNYQTFESNEMLNTKLMAGNSGYDIVVPGAVFAKPQIEAGLLQKLDKSKIPNLKNLDPAIMQKLAAADPGNGYLVPWGWSFVSVSINTKAVAKALGGTPLPANAWDLVFNPTYTNKLKSCGIAYLDTASEILPSALRYIGKPAYSTNVADYQLAGAMLAKVRPDVRIFTSTMIDDLASGKACVGLGWAGDMNIARHRAVENGAGVELKVLVPENGAILFFDNLAIPKDAKHVGNAHQFINYFLRPEVSAQLSNYLSYPVANVQAKSLVKPEIAQDPSTYLSAADMGKMVAPESFTKEARAAMTEVFTRFKKGN
jgi:putrescine transport system substrate-binding protein